MSLLFKINFETYIERGDIGLYQGSVAERSKALV
jgi:hypothetical protein